MSNYSLLDNMLDSTESNGANAQDEPATTVSPPRSSSKDTQDALIGINGGVSDIKNSIKRLVKYTLAESDSEDDDKHKKHSGTALNDDNPGNDSADSDLEGVGTSADPLSKTLDGIEPDHAFKTPDENRSELIPNVRDCNTDQFKTRVQDEKLHVIDVLLAPASPKMAVTSEDPHKPKGKTIALPVPKPDKTETPQTQDTNAWIHRIRINSPVLIQHLREFGNQDGLTQSGPVHKENKPWTFMRPFQYLIHYQDAMKGRLEEIRATDKLVVNNAHRISDPALSHLQCYIDFLEDRVMPCYRRLQEISSEEMPKVRFDDLWYIFKFGGLIYVPSNEHSEANASQKMSTFQSLRRIYRIQNPLHGDESFTDDLCKRSGCDRSNQAWITYCYYIDFDGEAFGAITEKLEIKPYSGEKQVDQLGFYPIEYLKDSHEILSKAKDDGQKVVNAIQQRYGFYSGWTLTTGPLGKGLVDSEGYDIKNSSHIESDVLVDYREAFSSFPPWRPGLQKRTKDSLSMYVNVHSKSIRQAGPKNTKRSSVDRIVYDDGIESLEFNRYLEKDRNLKIDKSRPVTEKNDVMNLPSGEDLALVPRRIIAYVVWERRFVHLDVRHLKIRDQKGNEEAFDQLEIGETHKKLIKSLVQSHFQKKKVEQKEHIDIETQDLIRGKGKGTIMLLHGVPGVGKTATAEAVAQKWSKPLFPITCGDLGFTAESVETSLNGIFRLAHLWDCVLLLDEADVFIAQRRSGDLQRNALVSGKLHA